MSAFDLLRLRLPKIGLLCLLSISALTVSAADLKPVKFCVWDPVGTTGPFLSFLRQTKLSAINWGVDLQMEAYTDEKVAANDFRAGNCDAVFVTNILAKDFVPFSAAFAAPGAIRSLEELKTLSSTLNTQKARELITYKNYEVSGLFPIGEIYAFTNDRSNVRIASMSGKKVSILNADIASTRFAEVVGASPVHTTLATWSGQFNNGNIDVLFGPALAYNTFELYKGLGQKGGIVKYNILYAVMVMLVNTERVPGDFAGNMRGHALTRFDELEATVKKSTSEIAEHYWVELDEQGRAEYDNLTKQVRLSLRDDKSFDPRAISLLWKIRCNYNPSSAECSTKE